MQIKLFTIPVTDTGPMAEEMNRFLRGNKILETQQQLVSNERGAFWCFCIKYIEQQQPFTPGTRAAVDYKQLLDDETFKKFSRLREIRKQIAVDEAVPAYAVFTDEELAGLAKLESLTPKTMVTVKGVGEKKIEKYAVKIITAYNNNKSNEKTG